MSKFRLYLRMGARGVLRNRQLYLPFILAAAGCVAMCYILRFLAYSELVATMRGGVYAGLMLNLGSGILVFLVVWILVYANGFVMHRRARELALYSVLGLRRRDVGAIHAVETVLVWLAGTVLGIGAGVLLSKLALVLLLRLMLLSVPMGFSFCVPGAAESAAAFALLFAGLYLWDLRRIFRAKPIELLHAGQMGEREPRSRRLLALFGVVCLGGGYALSFFTTDMLFVLLLFFAAVGLVIIGTHCLFGAGSVVLLKALRRNKRFYYHPRRFIAVSGLLYRMNQNAKGLANICILVTTVLVSVATTICLYAGIEVTLDRNYPHEIMVSGNCDTDALADADYTWLDTLTADAAAPWTDAPTQGFAYCTLGAQATQAGYVTRNSNDPTGLTGFYLIAAEDYTALTGQEVSLDPGTALLLWPEGGSKDLVLDGQTWKNAGQPEEWPRPNVFDAAYEQGTVWVVLPRRADLAGVVRAAEAAGAMAGARYAVLLDPAGLTEDQLLDCATAIDGALPREGTQPGFDAGLYVYNRAGIRLQYYAMNGSFVFLGVFLALMFSLATVLMIYYKQLSEGYEDRSRFIILQQVGLSAGEVRGAIRTQVLGVFFLPLAGAAVHLVAASPMLMRMIAVFGLADAPLFWLCAGGTLAVFGLCYVGVYALTARQYYHIVRM